MQKKLMGFLDTGCVVVWHDKRVIGDLDRSATVATEKRERGDPQTLGNFQSAKDVGRLTAGSEGDQEIAGLTDGLKLTGEDVLKAIVVADAREHGSVSVERDSGQRAPVALVAAREFSGKMLRFTGTAAIAADKQLVSGPERGGRHLRGVVQILVEFVESSENGDGLLERFSHRDLRSEKRRISAAMGCNTAANAKAAG